MRTDERNNWTRYSYHQGQPVGGTTHAAGNCGRTKCEVKIGRLTDDGGNWERDWMDVSCQRCLRKMEG